MGSSCPQSVEQDLALKISHVGSKLLELPEDIDQQLNVLESAGRILSMIRQDPSTNTKTSLAPLLKAMVKTELLHSKDTNVQVAVAFCFSEISRISAPTWPFQEEDMKDFFRLILNAYKQLPMDSGRNCPRALQILCTMAVIRSGLMMLDIEIDEIIIEMFKVFLNTITPDHPKDTSKNMEIIMSLVIEESDEISVELLAPLLESVRMDNKDISIASWELGNAVIKKCSAKLRSYLTKAVKSMNLNVGDYAEIVSSLCQDAPSDKNMVEQEIKLTDAIDGPSNVKKENKGRGKKKGKKIEDESMAKKQESKNACKRSVSPHDVSYGEELVNLRVKIWWPEDKTFYTGTVASFDPATKKHQIIYDDDEEEILKLNEETWDLLDENDPIQTRPVTEQEDVPGPAKETTKTRKKRKASSSKKKQATSKRYKGESSKGTESGARLVHIKDEPNVEVSN